MSNPPTGVWAEGEKLELTEDLRIGDTEGTGPSTFGTVSFFEVDGQGDIWVFDGHSQEIRVFDRTGRFVQVVGGQGQGPGEFNMAIGMSFSPKGDLWVLDPGNMRFTIFDSSGTFKESRSIEGGAIIIPWPGGFDRQGRLHHYARRPSEDGEGFDLVMVRYDSLLIPLDTLRIPPFETPPPFEFRVGQAYMSTAVPFTPSPRWHLSPQGEIWSTEAAEYTVVRLSSSGDTLLHLSKGFSPSPVTGDDMDRAWEELDWFTEAGGQIDPRRIPDRKPALEDFFFDDTGRIWVIPFGEEKKNNPTLHVFDGEGRFLGEVRIPFPLRTNPPPMIRHGFLYAVSTDAFDVQFVVRNRIH